MPVKFVELVSIDAKRFSKRGERIVKIANNAAVTLVTEVSDKEANIDFKYIADYGTGGTIKIEGRIMYEGDASALTKQWSSKMSIPENVASEIFTAIMRTCLLEAGFIARELHLPPPMCLPIFIPCPICGASIEKDAKFCNKCGKTVSEEKLPKEEFKEEEKKSLKETSKEKILEKEAEVIEEKAKDVEEVKEKEEEIPSLPAGMEEDIRKLKEWKETGFDVEHLAKLLRDKNFDEFKREFEVLRKLIEG